MPIGPLQIKYKSGVARMSAATAGFSPRRRSRTRFRAGSRIRKSHAPAWRMLKAFRITPGGGPSNVSSRPDAGQEGPLPKVRQGLKSCVNVSGVETVIRYSPWASTCLRRRWIFCLVLALTTYGHMQICWSSVPIRVKSCTIKMLVNCFIAIGSSQKEPVDSVVHNKKGGA